MALVVTYLLVLLVIGGLYVHFSGSPGSGREEAVSRIGALLWGLTGAAILGGIFLFVGLLWALLGLTWQLAFNSQRFKPGSSWSSRLKRYILFPYDQLVYGITGSGSFSWLP